MFLKKHISKNIDLSFQSWNPSSEHTFITTEPGIVRANSFLVHSAFLAGRIFIAVGTVGQGGPDFSRSVNLIATEHKWRHPWTCQLTYTWLLLGSVNLTCRLVGMSSKGWHHSCSVPIPTKEGRLCPPHFYSPLRDIRPSHGPGRICAHDDLRGSQYHLFINWCTFFCPNPWH